MSMHKLTAGDGYAYLTRHVAAGDTGLASGQSLTAYYEQTGNPAGRWHGAGLEALGYEAAGRVAWCRVTDVLAHFATRSEQIHCAEQDWATQFTGAVQGAHHGPHGFVGLPGEGLAALDGPQLGQGELEQRQRGRRGTGVASDPLHKPVGVPDAKLLCWLADDLVQLVVGQRRQDVGPGVQPSGVFRSAIDVAAVIGLEEVDGALAFIDPVDDSVIPAGHAPPAGEPAAQFAPRSWSIGEISLRQLEYRGVSRFAVEQCEPLEVAAERGGRHDGKRLLCAHAPSGADVRSLAG